ncbi:MAG: hypothetical protein MUP70_14820, partial [Candidatus Aminicenantes bacterium]|nr:hypothetical protein [Candidatus Aminicenantes bacterium]
MDRRQKEAMIPEGGLNQAVRAYAEKQEVSLFGVADITEIRETFHLEPRTISRFSRAISIGKRLLDTVLDDIEDKPTPLYFHHYRQLNFYLDRTAFLTASFIQKMGFRALPIAASQITDWDKQTAHVSHKHIGLLAGLGWIGRNNLLINPEFGARFRLVTILTDMPLTSDQPLDMDCGECRACLSSCPAGAIRETKEAFDHKG